MTLPRSYSSFFSFAFSVALRRAVLIGLSLFLSLANQPALAESEVGPEAGFASLPVKPFQWNQPKKEALAESMRDWTVKTLQANHAKLGLVARQGAYVTRLFDRTGMTHSGFVFQHPETGEWITYSLYSDPDNGRKTALLWRQNLKDFFYGQRSNRKEALLLIPDRALQEKMLKRLYAQPFHTLLPENHRYNLVAPVESLTSFNCTKWLVLNLYAARENSEDVPSLIQVMRREYPVKTVRPGLLTRFVLKRKPDVDWQELNPPGVVRTVTVDSLYYADFFEKQALYSGKASLKGIHPQKFAPIGD